MPASFVDTSALLKLYVAEMGSSWMFRRVLSTGIVLSALTVPEIGATLSRHAREGTISERQARAAWITFRRQLRTFAVLTLDRRSLERAAQIVARSPIVLRTLDAIQLQGAVEVRAEARSTGAADPIVISADARLLAAAAALGFATDNPLNHP